MTDALLPVPVVAALLNAPAAFNHRTKGNPQTHHHITMTAELCAPTGDQENPIFLVSKYIRNISEYESDISNYRITTTVISLITG